MTSDFSNIKDKISEKMKVRDEIFPYYKSITKFQKNLLQFLLPCLMLIIPPIINPDLTIGFSKVEKIGLILSYFLLIGFVVPEYIEQRKGPNEKMDYDIWVFKTGQRSYLIRSISLFIASIGLFLSTSAIIKIYPMVENEIIFFILGVFFMALFEFMVILSVLNVNFLFSKFNRYFSTVVIAAQFYSFFIFLQNIPILNYLRWILLIFVVFGFSRAFDKKRLSYNQVAALKFISPTRLYGYIEQKASIFDIKMKVLNDLREKYNNQEYQYLKFLSEELSRMDVTPPSKTYNKWFISIPLTIILFTISSVGEGIVQDLFNDSIKEWICRAFGLMCK